MQEHEMLQKKSRIAVPIMTHPGIELIGKTVLEAVIDGQIHAAALLEATSGFDNFILSTGCDVPPHVPFENISAFYEALEEYNNRGL